MTVTDNFNRASLGTDWAQRWPTLQIYNSAEVLVNVNNDECRADWVANVCHRNQRAQITVAQIHSANYTQYIGVSLRGLGAVSTNKTYYGFQCDRISQYCFSYVDYVSTMYLNGGATGVAVNDVIKMEIVGTTLKAWVNSTELVNTTSSDIYGGQVGVCGFDNAPHTGSDSTRGDNFEASWDDWAGVFPDRSDYLTGATSSSPSGTAIINAASNVVYAYIVGYYSGGAWSVSSVSFGGQAMSLVSAYDHPEQVNHRSEIWKLVNPPTGSQTLSWTLSATVVTLSGWCSFGKAGTQRTVAKAAAGATIVSPSVSSIDSATGEVILSVISYFGGNSKICNNSTNDITNRYYQDTDWYDMATSWKDGVASTTVGWTISGQDNSRWTIQAFSVQAGDRPSFQIRPLRPAIFTPGFGR